MNILRPLVKRDCKALWKFEIIDLVLKEEIKVWYCKMLNEMELACKISTVDCIQMYLLEKRKQLASIYFSRVDDF